MHADKAGVPGIEEDMEEPESDSGGEISSSDEDCDERDMEQDIFVEVDGDR